MGNAPSTPSVAQQNLNTLLLLRSWIPLAVAIVAVIVVRRTWGLKFWGSLGTWVAATAVTGSIVYVATQKKWNASIENGAVNPFDITNP